MLTFLLALFALACGAFGGYRRDALLVGVGVALVALALLLSAAPALGMD